MSAQYDWIKSHFRNLFYVHDPADSTTPVVIAWVPMGEHFLASLMLISGTGVANARIMAATDGSGTGSTLVKAHAGPTVADAAGDTIHIETAPEEVKAALDNASHVGLEVTGDVATDIFAIGYTLKGGSQGGRFDEDAMTADVIA